MVNEPLLGDDPCAVEVRLVNVISHWGFRGSVIHNLKPVQPIALESLLSV